MHELKVRAVKENLQYLEVMGTSPSVPTDCFLGNDYDTFDKQIKEIVKKGEYEGVQDLLGKIFEYFEKNAGAKVDEYLTLINRIEDQSNKLTNYWGVDTSNLYCRYQGYSSRGSEPLKVFAQLYVVHKARYNLWFCPDSLMVHI